MRAQHDTGRAGQGGEAAQRGGQQGQAVCGAGALAKLVNDAQGPASTIGHCAAQLFVGKLRVKCLGACHAPGMVPPTLPDGTVAAAACNPPLGAERQHGGHLGQVDHEGALH